MPEATTRRLLLALTAVMAALLCAPGSAPGKALQPHEIASSDLWEPQPERVQVELVRIPGSHLVDLAIVTPNASGRTKWLSRDPLGERGGLNLYGFVGNDPVDNVDYLGMVTIMQGDGSFALFPNDDRYGRLLAFQIHLASLTKGKRMGNHLASDYHRLLGLAYRYSYFGDSRIGYPGFGQQILGVYRNAHAADRVSFLAEGQRRAEANAWRSDPFSKKYFLDKAGDFVAAPAEVPAYIFMEFFPGANPLNRFASGSEAHWNLDIDFLNGTVSHGWSVNSVVSDSERAWAGGELLLSLGGGIGSLGRASKIARSGNAAENWLSSGRKVSLSDSAPGTTGSGPASGLLEVSSRYPSTGAVRGFRSSNPTDFVFDAKTNRFVIGTRINTGKQGAMTKINRGHPETAQQAGMTVDGQVVGGRIRYENGRLLTDEHSGRLGLNWTPEIRAQFDKFVRENGLGISHTPWTP